MISEPGMATHLEAVGLFRSRAGKSLLQGVGLHVKAGEIVSLRGPSGCGKSSLLRCLSRLDALDAGELRLTGMSAREIPVRTWRQRVAHLFQSACPLPGSLADNLRYGASLQGRILDRQDILATLASVGLETASEQDASTLSGGEAQRLALARVLINRPEILLLDEPTASLDEASREAVEALVTESVKSSGIGCLWVTHDPTQAERVATRHLRMEAGRLLAEGAV